MFNWQSEKVKRLWTPFSKICVKNWNKVGVVHRFWLSCWKWRRYSLLFECDTMPCVEPRVRHSWFCLFINVGMSTICWSSHETFWWAQSNQEKHFLILVSLFLLLEWQLTRCLHVLLYVQLVLECTKGLGTRLLEVISAGVWRLV